MRRTAIILLLALGQLQAATYYIDWVGGSDANVGSKVSPWKRAPGMPGFAASYSYASGDDYIFKGGVTWPAAALGMVINNNGTSANRSVFGVDATWYTGGSWSRPIFNAGGVILQNSNTARGSPILINGDYITIDNIEVTNFVILSNADSWFSGIGVHTSASPTIIRCYIHDWVVQSVGDGSFGGVHPYNSTNVTVEDCVIDAPNTIAAQYVTRVAPGPYTSGCGTDEVQIIRGNTIIGTTQGIFNCSLAEDNILIDIDFSYLQTAHGNVFNAYNGGTWRRNQAYNSGYGTCAFLVPGWDSNNGTIYFYNNIIWDTRASIPIKISEAGNIASATSVVHIYNNILKHGGTAILNGNRSNDSLDSVTIRNNVFITNASDPVVTEPPAVTPVESNNHTFTYAQAAAAGIVSSNLFIGSRGNSNLAGQGANLSAFFTTDFLGVTRTVPWDIGAYESSGGPAPVPGNIQLTSDVYAASEGAGTITISAERGGGTSGAVAVSWATSNTSPVSAAAGTDYTAASGTFSWADGNSANKTTAITIAQDATVEGDESFLFTISAPTGGATLDSPAQAVVTINDDEVTTPLVPLMAGLTFEVEDMLIETPFVETSTYVSQPVQTTTPSAGGRARARVTIPSTGNYRIAMNVNAPTTGNDSAFVDFDTEPTTPTTIWDVLPSPTSGIQARNVSWRGTGTFSAPQFVDKEWTLSAGEHTLYIRGREPGMQLDSVTIFSATTVDTTPPTPNPAVIDNVTSTAVFVSLEAQPAADVTGPIEYQFEVTGGPGGTVSAWQSSEILEMSLYPGKAYEVRTRYRDSADPPNVGTWSAPANIIVPVIDGAGARRPR